MKRIRKVFRYIHHYGLKLFLLKLITKPRNSTINYMEWRKRFVLSEQERHEQENIEWKRNYKISIIVPTYETSETFLREMIESVLRQTYSNWELCIIDGSNITNAVEKVVCEYVKSDKRIIYKKLDSNLGIAGNTNVGLDIATGDFIGLLDHDDILAENALFEVADVIESNDSVDIVYTDEDKVNIDLTEYYDPHFKSDFNLDLLRSNNYICHFFVVRKSLIDLTGKFRKEFEGAQDYDFILRCTEKAREIKHISKVLYHWRTHSKSTSENPESKLYAYQAGKHAIEEHLVRQQISGKVYCMEDLGFYSVKYRISGRPKILIVLAGDEKYYNRCRHSIIKHTLYDNYVIHTKEGLENAKNEYEFIVLMDSSVEIITKNWLEEMLGCCQRENVGIVGGKLYLKNETIKHAGIILGMKGYAFEGMPRVLPGYFHREKLIQNLSAVSKMLMMIKVELFDEIDKLKQLDEYEICKKVTECSKLIVYNPRIESYIMETEHPTMGKEHKVWGKDKYYNENLSLSLTTFDLQEEC